MTDVMAGAAGEMDLEGLAHPQPLFKMLRDAGPIIEMDELGMVIVGGDADVRHVLQHPEVFSSGIDAVNEILASFDIPVIFITAYPEKLLTGERPEPTYLIAKPFLPETVQATVGQALFFHPVAKQAA